MRRLVLVSLVWSGVAFAKPDPAEVKAIEKTIATQLAAANEYDKDVPDGSGEGGFISVLGPFQDETHPAKQLKKAFGNYADDRVKATKLKVLSFSRDGQTAIVTFDSPNVHHDDAGGVYKYTFRASEVMIKPTSTWQVWAGLWSTGVSDAAINKRAKEGDQREFVLLAEKSTGHPELNAALQAFLTKGFDLAHVHPNLVGIGSAPNEVYRGKALATGWNKGWAGKLAIVGGTVATVFGEGDKANTGYGFAHVMLAKGTYKVQFRVFVVFEKDETGAWQPWHVHVATNDF